MTVSTAPTPLSYSTDGSPASYPITWKYNAKSHVVATLRSSAGVETVWALTTNYTLTDPGDTGTLTPVVLPATGQTLVITLEPPNTQSSDIPLGGDFPSTTVEDAIDLAAQRDGKIEALFLRALRVPKTDTQTGSSLELPIDSLRASTFLAFDADGKPIAAAGTSADLGPVSVFINTLLDDTTAEAARTTLGAAASSSAVIVLDANTTTFTFSNTVTRTDIYTFSVPANTLGTSGMLRLTLMGKCLNTTGVGQTALIGLGYGTVDNIRGTTIGGITVSDTDGADFSVHLDLYAKGATNAQTAFARITNGASSARQDVTPFLEQSGAGGNFILAKHEALAVDSTADKTLYVSVKLSAASPDLSCSMLNARLEALG
jgi:hypothetical protein